MVTGAVTSLSCQSSFSVCSSWMVTSGWTSNGWLQAIRYPNRMVAPFAYDDSGRRVWKSGTSFRPDGTLVPELQRYVHDGEAILAELGESPGGGYHPVQRYLHGIGVLARERLEDDAAVRTRRPDADDVPTRRPVADSVRTRRPDAGPLDRQYSAATRSRNDTPGSGRPVGTLGHSVRTPEAPGAGPGSTSPTALQTLFHHADGLNSTVNVTRSDGSVKNAYLYDAWGNHRELEAGGECLTAPDLGLDGFIDRDAYLGNLASAFAEDDNRLTFTGLEAEPETGLFFAQSRFYDPEAGRGVRTRRPDAGPPERQYSAVTRSYNDTPGSGRPVRTPGRPVGTRAPVSLHKYLYANASPTRFVDPSGRSAEDTVPAATLETGDLGGSESAARPSADQDLPEGGSLAAYEVAKSKARWPLSLSVKALVESGAELLRNPTLANVAGVLVNGAMARGNVRMDLTFTRQAVTRLSRLSAGRELGHLLQTGGHPPALSLTDDAARVTRSAGHEAVETAETAAQKSAVRSAAHNTEEKALQEAKENIEKTALPKVDAPNRGAAVQQTWTKTRTPWQRVVYQRNDIDWDFLRPEGTSLAGKTNWEAATQGYAPVRLNPGTGKVEDAVLHHMNQDPRGGVAELWRSTHGKVPQKMDPPGPWRQIKSEWDKAWRREQPAYWRWRSGEYNPPPTDKLRLPGD